MSAVSAASLCCTDQARILSAIPSVYQRVVYRSGSPVYQLEVVCAWVPSVTERAGRGRR